MNLTTVNVHQAIHRAEHPFILVELAAVDEIVLHGYICQGAVNWHKHIDSDEAFLVLDGAMALESEWGNVMLHAGELAVVPKGISHRSGSQLRTIVVLAHARGLPDRKNGQRRVLGIPGGGQLSKARLYQMSPHINPFLPESVGQVNESSFQLVTGNGPSPGYTNYHSHVIWLVLRGQARFDIEDETAELAPGELLVTPRGATYYWFSEDQTTLLWLGLARSTSAEADE